MPGKICVIITIDYWLDRRWQQLNDHISKQHNSNQYPFRKNCKHWKISMKYNYKAFLECKVLIRKVYKRHANMEFFIDNESFMNFYEHIIAKVEIDNLAFVCIIISRKIQQQCN